MVTLSLLVQMKAKAGKEGEVEAFLRSAQPLVDQENGTIAWFAIRISLGRYAIFDAFENDVGRNAHLTGRVAELLFAKAPDLFSEPPSVEKPDILAVKLPR